MDDLVRLNEQLSMHSYINGFEFSDEDLRIFHDIRIIREKLMNYPHVNRWFNHIASISEEFSRPSKEEKNSSELNMDDENDIPLKLLNYLNNNAETNTLTLANVFNIDHQKIIGAMNSLLMHEDELIVSIEQSTKNINLTMEGEEFVKNGSHEANVFNMVTKDGILQEEIIKLPFGKVGISKAIAAGWIAVEKMDKVKLVRKVSSIEDKVREELRLIAQGKSDLINGKTLQELKRRKLIAESIVKSFLVGKGSSFTINPAKPELEVTAEMITSGSWKEKRWKKYNFNAMGVVPSSGHQHPLMKVRHEFRQIFFQLGFTEMPTNRYVESSFWNFDALFQPQQHPARDAHDTFFVSYPEMSNEFPKDYLERVKKVHMEGGYGSRGYNYEWKLEEAQKNILRTHTTAVSARQLYEIAQKGFKPTKMFSIDRVFRNETLDATHLAEFHQVEGVIAERNLSLAHMMGLLTEFFRKCGIKNLRFKPTYNPYTEPSMEVFAYHDGLKKWVEIGNSGMFRPEMLLPMGLPPDVNVAGYGLSLERPTMIRYGLSNIRDLFGPKVDLQMIYNNPICRLDKA